MVKSALKNIGIFAGLLAVLGGLPFGIVQSQIIYERKQYSSAREKEALILDITKKTKSFGSPYCRASAEYYEIKMLSLEDRTTIKFNCDLNDGEYFFKPYHSNKTLKYKDGFRPFEDKLSNSRLRWN